MSWNSNLQVQKVWSAESWNTSDLQVRQNTSTYHNLIQVVIGQALQTLSWRSTKIENPSHQFLLAKNLSQLKVVTPQKIHNKQV